MKKLRRQGQVVIHLYSVDGGPTNARTAQPSRPHAGCGWEISLPIFSFSTFHGLCEEYHAMAFFTAWLR